MPAPPASASTIPSEPPKPGEYAEAALRRGERLRKEGKLDDAIFSFRTALEFEPKHARARYLLGSALWEKGEKLAALVELRQATELAPNELMYRSAYERLKKEIEQPGKAGDSKVKRTWTSDDFTASGAATAGEGPGGPIPQMAPPEEKASTPTDANVPSLPATSKPAEADPEDAKRVDALRACQQSLSGVDGAKSVSACRDAVKLDPENAGAHTGLCIAYRNTRDYDKAESSCRRALSLAPQNAIAHFNLGYIYWERMKPGEAIASLKRAVAANANFFDAHLLLARVLTRPTAGISELNEASKYYEQARKIRPNERGLIDEINAHYNRPGVQKKY
jgi:Flp pilus assembly protein TadD